MKLNHEEIKAMLPEYLKGAMSSEIKDNIDAHLKDCADCREELDMLSGLMAVGVPDPGELFWKTLPQKVKASYAEKKPFRISLRSPLLSRFPIATGIVVIFLLVFTFITKKNGADFDPFFKDPLSVSVLDYNNTNEKDIPSVDDYITTDELPMSQEELAGYSYQREFTSLSSKELQSLYEALKEEQKEVKDEQKHT